MTMQAGLKGANAIKPCTASMTFVITIPRCTGNFAWSGRMPSFIILDCFEVGASWVTGQILGLFQLRCFCSIQFSFEPVDLPVSETASVAVQSKPVYFTAWRGLIDSINTSLLTFIFTRCTNCPLCFLSGHRI